MLPLRSFAEHFLNDSRRQIEFIEQLKIICYILFLKVNREKREQDQITQLYLAATEMEQRNAKILCLEAEFSDLYTWPLGTVVLVQLVLKISKVRTHKFKSFPRLWGRKDESKEVSENNFKTYKTLQSYKQLK